MSGTGNMASPLNRRRLARQLMIILGLFTIAVVLALLATELRERRAGLLASTVLKQMKTELAKAPKDQALKDAIRRQDLTLRERDAANRRRMKGGAYLAILALAGWILAARWHAALAPAKTPEELLAGLTQALDERRGAGAWAVGGVSALILLGLLAEGLWRPAQLPPLGEAKAQIKAGKKTQAPVAKVAAVTPTPQATPAPPAPGETWPCFRGPDNIGVATAPGPWPRAWNAAQNKNILWKTEIPVAGKSSPIVWGERIFVSGGDKNEQRLICLDRVSGKLLWNTALTAPPVAGEVQEFESTGFSAPTPVTDGQRVYVLYASGLVGAFDFSGKQLWARQLGVPESTYGFATSLMLYENTLLLQFDQGSDAESKKSNLLGLDPATGTTRWSTPRPVPNSWSTPALIRTPARVELVTCAAPWIIAYDPLKGSELWRAGGFDGDVAPAPAFGAGLIFVANDRAKLMAIRPGGQGDVTASHVVWSSDVNLPDIASPVTDGKRLLEVAPGGQLTCFSAPDGKQLWEENIGVGVSASPILAGGLVYLTGEDGLTRVIELGDTYQLRDQGEVGEPVYATPAFAHARIYLRGSRHLFCIGGAQ